MKNRVRLPDYVKPERYKIRLEPDLENFIFSGEETIFFSLEKATKQIILHAVDLEIESREAEKISYDKKSETATFTFSKPLQKGKSDLKLIFKGILNDKMRGFYRSKYIHEGKEKHLATTQFEATDARRAFPCFDEPAQKSIFDVSFKIPSHLQAISNTIESSVLEDRSGYKIIEFASTPKMSTYLLAFIVGDFEYIQDGRVRVFTTPGKKSQAKFALDVATKCLDFYEEYFDIDYPLPVLDLIAIPDFAAGAMENWGAVTYRESTLLIDEATSSTANKQWVALVIAHELAHMWFGDLVTMEWWTHLWLNEGFAVFIEYLAIDHIFPSWEIWKQFVATELHDAFELDSLSNTHPIEVAVKHPSEISEIFDEISYAKGAVVLRMLWKYLGEKDFQRGLQHYLKKHSYGNANTKDLWKALEEVSGKPVTKIMSNWVLKPGHPVISAKCNPSATLRTRVQSSKLELTQSRFYTSSISKKESKDKTVWSIPLNQFLMDKKTLVIPNKKEKLNLGETSFVRIDYPKGYLDGLKLSAPDRLGAVRDAFDLAQSGQSETSLALELVGKFKDETDYIVWASITSYFGKLDSLLSYESFHESFKAFGRIVYKDIANKMSWEKRKEEKHSDGLLRGMVLYRLGAFGDKDTIKKAQELFASRGSTPKTASLAVLGVEPLRAIDPDLRSVVYNLVAENGGRKEFDTLVKMYKDEDNQQEKDRIGRALGLFKDKILLKNTLEFAISKHVRFQNSLQIIASVWGNPQGRYLAWEFVKENWKLLKERYAGGHYFTRVFQPAADFNSIEDAKDIEKFVTKHPVPEAKRTIAQVLEQIRSNAVWLARDREKIKSFLQNYP